MVHKFVVHNFVYQPHFSAFSSLFCLFAPLFDYSFTKRLFSLSKISYSRDKHRGLQVIPKNRELIKIIHRINKYDKSN